MIVSIKGSQFQLREVDISHTEPTRSYGRFPHYMSSFIWRVCIIKSQAIKPFKNNVVIICNGFINLIQDLYMDSLTHFLLLSISILPLTYIINPPSGMPHCSSVTWIYANGCLHMLISHIYIKLNSLLHCFLTLCPHMINFPDFFQNRY